MVAEHPKITLPFLDATSGKMSISRWYSLPPTTIEAKLRLSTFTTLLPFSTLPFSVRYLLSNDEFSQRNLLPNTKLLPRHLDIKLKIKNQSSNIKMTNQKCKTFYLCSAFLQFNFCFLHIASFYSSLPKISLDQNFSIHDILQPTFLFIFPYKPPSTPSLDPPFCLFHEKGKRSGNPLNL